jgi:branched-chain amino acid transport system substrate-binding protein
VKTLELGGKAVNGTMLPANYFSTDPRPAAQKFTQEYKALYGSEPNQFAALAYDAAGVLVAALKAVGTDSRAKVRDGLIGLKGYEGATGPISYAEGRDPAKQLVRIMIRDGQWQLYKP